MSPSDRQSPLWLAGSGLKQAIRFATYDWTRELPFSLRVITMIGMGIQGYAIWAALSGSLIWPIMWPSGVILYATILLIYYIGFCIQNATLASELIHKTQLESEQFAAQTIQKTLQPTTIDEIPGYEVDAFYKPLRAVGGDYFDVVDLPGNRTLFVVADVSGKGMAAALLAANIQALVRSLSTIAPDVAALASQINRHLFRYTPGNRFATAAFIVLDRDSGELAYVNAGHNPPIVWRAGQTNLLEATGTALGWFDDTTYDVGRMTIPHDGGLLIYTDGLPDSIPGNSPEDSLYRALDNDLARTMSNLKAVGGSSIQRGRCHRIAGEANGGIGRSALRRYAVTDFRPASRSFCRNSRYNTPATYTPKTPHAVSRGNHSVGANRRDLRKRTSNLEPVS